MTVTVTSTCALVLLVLSVHATAEESFHDVRGERFRRRIDDPASCSAPTPPNSLAFSNPPSRLPHSGRQRWRYYVSWTAPTSINCDSITNYEYTFPSDNDTRVVVTGKILTVEVYTDGNLPVRFSIYAKNNEDHLSAAASVQTTTPVLTPQKGPRSFLATASSPKCISLTWLPPEYPNGVISRYLYNCGKGWKKLSNKLSHTVCGFNPYTLVRCYMKAYNSAGYSISAIAPTTRTLCDSPSKPQYLTISTARQVVDEDRDRWEYTANWQAPISIYCESLIGYTTSYPTYAENILEDSATSRVIRVDGNAQVAFFVTAMNTANKTSIIVSRSFKSQPLRPQKAPINVSLEADNSSCVTLFWQPPEYPNGDITSYQISCRTSGEWSVSNVEEVEASLRSYQNCGYNPNDIVQCRVRAVNSAGQSDTEESDEITTGCAAPSPPIGLSFGDAETVTHDGRQRWKYTISWQAPVEINCGSITSYTSVYGEEDTLTSPLNNREIYADGDVTLTFTVTATNDADLTSPVTSLTIRTPPREPQVAPRSLKVDPVNSTCVQIKWMQPKYPNGELKGYEYQLVGQEQWTSVTYDGNSSPLSFHLECSLSPHQSVQFQLLVFNDVGQSNSELTPINKTLCAGPTLPANLASYVTEESYQLDGGFHRRRIRITIPAELITANCESVERQEFWLEGSDERYSGDAFIEDLDAVTTYTVLYVVTNNQGMESVARVSVETGELEPSQVDLTVASHNLSCVALTWNKPKPANGVITNYQYRCWTDEANKPALMTTRSRTALSCGYQPADRVSCEVDAATAIGVGPSTSGTTTIECGAPMSPALAIRNKVKTMSSGMETANIKVSWPPSSPGCESVSSYEATVSLRGEPVFSETFGSDSALSFTVSDVLPFTNYKVKVKVTNNEGFSSVTERTWQSSQLKPTDPPTIDLSFDSGCVNITALTPTVTNGPITTYNYSCLSEVMKEGMLTPSADKTSAFSQVCGFLPTSKVICRVSANNEAGSSPAKASMGYTDLMLEKENMELPYTVMSADRDSTTVPVKLEYVSFVNVEASSSAYRLIVSLSGSQENRKKRSMVFGHCDTSKLYEYTSARKLGLTCYVAAEIKGDMITEDGYVFNLGDGETYGKFENVRLEPNTAYTVTVGVVVYLEEDTEMVQYFEPTNFKSPPPVIPTEKPPACSKNCLVGIVGGVAGAVFLIAVVIIAICCCRSSSDGGKKQAENSDVMMSTIEEPAETQPTPESPLLKSKSEGLESVEVKN